jgi:AraC-like DNA-binding protein
MGTILVWRVSLLVVFLASAMQLIVSLIAINTVLPQWARGITPQGKIDIALWTRFLELLNSRKGYLSPHLKMQDISLDLGVQDRALRAAIALNSEHSFPTIIALYRLKHFIEHTRREDLRNHSLEQLAAQSGFNSRTSLHRACIKWTKMSAAELINSERTIELTKFI